jgi:ribose transport system substrate-binding protein
MKQAGIIIALVLVAGVFITIGILRKGEDEGIRIVVIPKSTSSVFFEAMRAGAVKAGKEENVKIVWSGPEMETDREKQIQLVEDAITQKATGIVLAPNDDKALVPVVEKVRDRGIPCVIVDSGLDTEKYDSFLATDNYQGGVMAARRMGKILEGKGEILVIAWTPNSASTDKRAKGFRDTIQKEFPDIQEVGTKYPNPPTVESALQVTEDLLQDNPDINGIFTCNDMTSIGAMRAVQNHPNADKIKIVGFDAWDILVDGLRNGEVDSLVVQDPYKMGYEGVKTVLKVLRKETVKRHVDTGVTVVTKENMDTPEIKHLLDSQM